MTNGEGRRRATTHRWLDAVVVLALAGAAAWLSLAGSSRTVPALVEPRTGSAWFESDTDDFLRVMTDRTAGEHTETRIHPLFSLLVYPQVKVVRALTGLDPAQAVRVVLALAAALWLGTLVAVLRLMGCSRAAGAALGLVALASAGAVFWLTVPESYPFGSLSLALVLLVAAVSGHRRLSTAWHVLASAGSLSVTVTNWMAGWALLLARVPWRRAVQLSVNAFCLVVVLWAVEKTVFPKAKFFLENPKKGRFLFHPDAGGPARILPSLLVHSIVMPEIVEAPRSYPTRRPRMITQPSAPGSGSPWGPAAVALWLLLLGLGCWGAVTRKDHRELRLALGLTLAGQIALHLIYGEETFLYTLHLVPLLVVLAACGLATPMRRAIVPLAAALVVAAGLNNHRQFARAAGTLERYAAPAAVVLR
jgi:hypothetical protein